MKRKGIYQPTIEDIVEISDIETLHPGGFELTKRTAKIAQLAPGVNVLDVSSGRGTQAIFYASKYKASVTGVDISKKMIAVSKENAKKSGLEKSVNFICGDSQDLPFNDSSFDVVINECAVGIPDDSKKVLKEMVRVLKPKGILVMHESTWNKKLADSEKDELSERYGTTPLEHNEWIQMLRITGLTNIVSEMEKWSEPEMFWKVRKDRDVKHYSNVLTIPEKLVTLKRIAVEYGLGGIFKAFKNEKVFWKAVTEGKIGYCLYKGIKKS